MTTFGQDPRLHNNIEISTGFEFMSGFPSATNPLKMHDEMLAPLFAQKDTSDMLAAEDIDMWSEATFKAGLDQSMIAMPDGACAEFGFVTHHGSATKSPAWGSRAQSCSMELNSSPNCIKHRGASSPWGDSSDGVRLEPSHEPCTDDIPWCDLVFWLGNSLTGEVECSCNTCVCERSNAYLHMHGHHSERFERLSARIPVISMPRIEGVN
ncbi:TPA: hypothetical protein N0F65_009021 [Lagenidium giganteum]|uniref:Uncharacterized protein n=1 Tax=Lagenidium giganteum TaxID=4803 RepID=A0AAV2YTY6_9STRA|nr:TPA: hypothetical protein N0F65_009021 [Lagenidium giganteum]